MEEMLIYITNEFKEDAEAEEAEMYENKELEDEKNGTKPRIPDE